MLLWMTRKFKIARDVEQEVEDFIEAFSKMPEQKDGAAEAAKAEAEQKMKLLEMEKMKSLQIKEAESRAEQVRKDREVQSDIERKDREAEAKIERDKLLLAAKLRESGMPEDAVMAHIGKKKSSGNKQCRIIRENGKIVGAEITEDGETRRVAVA